MWQAEEEKATSKAGSSMGSPRAPRGLGWIGCCFGWGEKASEGSRRVLLSEHGHLPGEASVPAAEHVRGEPQETGDTTWERPAGNAPGLEKRGREQQRKTARDRELFVCLPDSPSLCTLRMPSRPRLLHGEFLSTRRRTLQWWHSSHSTCQLFHNMLYQYGNSEAPGEFYYLNEAKWRYR